MERRVPAAGTRFNSRKLLRLIGTFFILDGVLLLLFRRAYVRRWQAGPAGNRYRRAMDWLGARPAWLLRLAGVTEAGLGLAALARAPFHVREIYHLAAGIYDPASFLWRNWLYRDLHQAFDRALSTYLPSGGHVLDLGCGTGANLERLLALGLPFGSYTGVDLSEDMLARARAKFGHLANVSLQQLDLMTDPLPVGPFDLAISTWVFSHLPDPLLVVEKARDQLRPGKYLVLLFQTRVNGWLDPLVKPIASIFSARRLAEETYRRFPGLVSLDRFARGTAALAVLEKPPDTARTSS